MENYPDELKVENLRSAVSQMMEYTTPHDQPIKYTLIESGGLLNEAMDILDGISQSDN